MVTNRQFSFSRKEAEKLLNHILLLDYQDSFRNKTFLCSEEHSRKVDEGRSGMNIRTI